MCSARVNPEFVLEALKGGADGVLVAGCRMDECHYIHGNFDAEKRMDVLKEIIKEIGKIIEYRRIFNLKQTSYCYLTRLVGDKGIPDFTEKELLQFYEQVREKYKIIYLEDPFIESDKKSWQLLNRDLGETTTVAACRHVAAKVSEINKIKENNMANAIVLKPKQIGTISELMESIKCVKDQKLNLIISHSTGETLETLIVDLAVGVGANFVKFGPLNRGERIVKYNRLLDISRELNSKKG